MLDESRSDWIATEVGAKRVELRTSYEPQRGEHRLWPSVGEYPLYDDFFYHVMLEDDERNKSFEEVVRQHSAGRTVLELGTGPDLLWAALAAKNGAARVYAVEALEESAQAADARAKEIGPHVSVVHGDATKVTIQGKADMCIAELVGAIGGAEGIAAAIDDARERHLRPGALVVPHRVKTPIAALGAKDLLGGVPALGAAAAGYASKIFSSVGSIFDLRMCLSGLSSSDLLTTTDILEDLNLTTGVHEDPGRIRLEVTQSGEIDSCVLWLRLQCAPDQPYLDSMETPTNWTPVLVPFDVERAIPVEAGDMLDLDITRRTYDGVHPEWSFSGSISRRNGPTTLVRAECPYAGGPFRASWLHRALFREPQPPTSPDECS